VTALRAELARNKGRGLGLDGRDRGGGRECGLHPGWSTRVSSRGILGGMARIIYITDQGKWPLQVVLRQFVIGGDKLARGLTLEGLTVSYFLRASKMYDTLMQMGRWFGYRPGYLDLCRIYTTSGLMAWYRHIALAEADLRREFERMACRFHLLDYLRDLSVGADDECRPVHTHVLAAHELLQSPHAVRFGDGVAFVGKQREGQAELVLELLMRLH